MKILIIGGTGRLGLEISTALKHEGHEVHGTTSKPKPGFITLDLEERLSNQTVNLLINGVDAVIYTAADKNEYSLNSVEHHRQNVINAQNAQIVASSCIKAFKMFVYLSGAIVYEDHIGVVNKESSPLAKSSTSSYQNSKILAENLLSTLSPEDQGIAIIRPPSIYGGDVRAPGLIESKCIQAVNSGEIDIFQPELSRYNFIHASDLASFLVLILEDNVSGAINVANCESYSVREIVETVSILTGARIVRKPGQGVFDEEEKYRLELSRMKSVGWEPHITLHEGVSSILERLGKRTEG